MKISNANLKCITYLKMVRLKAKHYVLGGFVFRDILVVAGGYND